MIEVVEFSDEYRAELAIFCKECKELGFKNNESLEAMHVDDSNVVFWLVIIDGEIACVSGAQQLSASDANCIIQDTDCRIQYRTATLPKYQHYYKVNRYFGHVLFLKHLLIPMVEWPLAAKAERILITANTDSTYSPYMNRTARHCRNFGPNKRNMPVLFMELGNCILFGVEQIIFEVNQESIKWWHDQWEKVGVS